MDPMHIENSILYFSKFVKSGNFYKDLVKALKDEQKRRVLESKNREGKGNFNGKDIDLIKKYGNDYSNLQPGVRAIIGPIYFNTDCIFSLS